MWGMMEKGQPAGEGAKRQTADEDADDGDEPVDIDARHLSDCHRDAHDDGPGAHGNARHQDQPLPRCLCTCAMTQRVGQPYHHWVGCTWSGDRKYDTYNNILLHGGRFLIAPSTTARGAPLFAQSSSVSSSEVQYKSDYRSELHLRLVASVDIECEERGYGQHLASSCRAVKSL